MVSIYGVTCEISVVAWVGVDLNWLSLPLQIGIDYSLQHLFKLMSWELSLKVSNSYNTSLQK